MQFDYIFLHHVKMLSGYAWTIKFDTTTALGNTNVSLVMC